MSIKSEDQCVMEEKLEKVCSIVDWKVGERYSFCNTPYCCEWFVVSDIKKAGNDTAVFVHFNADIYDEGLYYYSEPIVAFEFALTPLEKELL